MSAQALGPVLLAEDSTPERLRLKLILEQEGYRVQEAEDGQAALDLLREQAFPLVVSDWQMPRLSGLELCRRIRDELGRDNCYFLMLTGRDARQDLLEAFAAGTDDFLTKPVDRDELLARLRVGQRLHRLQADLSRQYEQVRQALDSERQARALVDADLSAASLLQQELLPARFLRRPGLDVAHLFRPAAGLGGDMLNHVALDERTVGFFLLDVCGHGVAPALLSFAVAHALGEMFAETGAGVRPETLLQGLNRRFFDRSGNGRFFTIVLGLIDLDSGLTRISQAAHPPPLLLRQTGTVEEVTGGGLPVGVFEQAEYASTEITLADGELLMMYSDGLTECENPAGEQFGPQRLADLLSAQRGHGPEHLLQTLQTALGAWQGGEQFEDDLSILVLARRGVEEEPALELSLSSRSDEIAEAVDQLRDWLAAQGLAADLAFQFSVCLAEALNNIEEHGYGEDQPGPIAISVRLQPDAVACEVHDQATRIETAPETSLSAGDVEDGRGWFILRSWMDRVEYLPVAAGNRLRMVKFTGAGRPV